MVFFTFVLRKSIATINIYKKSKQRSISVCFGFSWRAMSERMACPGGALLNYSSMIDVLRAAGGECVLSDKRGGRFQVVSWGARGRGYHGTLFPRKRFGVLFL